MYAYPFTEMSADFVSVGNVRLRQQGYYLYDRNQPVGLLQGSLAYLIKSLQTTGILDVLSKYGANAHMWIPGIGAVDGILVKNYLDAAGTTPATLNNPVGRADDVGGGTSNVTQTTDALRPTLALDVNNHYNWVFNGASQRLALPAPIFQLSDDFCVVAGVSLTTSGTERAIFAQSNGSNHALPEFMFNAQGKLGAYAFGGGGTVSSFGGSDNTGIGPIVATMINTSGTVKVRRDSVQVTSITLTGTYATATTSALATYPRLTNAEFLIGSLYPVVAIKGTVSDSDLAIIEQFVASRSTMVDAAVMIDGYPVLIDGYPVTFI